MSELHRFVFDGLPVRGILVRLSEGWREVLARRADASLPWPEPVRHLLGEMTAAGVLMHANIKFAGDLILQVFGDGPVKLAVAEIRADLSFRVTATVRGAVAEDAAHGQALEDEAVQFAHEFPSMWFSGELSSRYVPGAAARTTMSAATMGG